MKGSITYGDWVDEFCDLTLDKLIEQTSKDIVHEISIPTNPTQLMKQLEQYEEVKDSPRMVHQISQSESIFKKVTHLFDTKFKRNK